MARRKTVEVKLSDIHPNLNNPRRGTYDSGEMDELKESMQVMGQLTPIKLDEKNNILGGHRRHHAAKELGWTTLRAEIFDNLSPFDRSAVMISDNTTQKHFNHWDARKTISDIYWNEFCEEYNFKSGTDKGYTEFGRKLGISKLTVTKIVESMQKDNLKIARDIERAGLGTEVFDTILSSPKKFRKDMTKKAIKLRKDGKRGITGAGLRVQLRMFKKNLVAKESKSENFHPNFFATIYYSLNSLGEILTKEVLKKANVNERIKLLESIEKNVIPFYNKIKNTKR